MLEIPFLRPVPVIAALLCAGLTACASAPSAQRLATAMSVYKIDIVQGNVVTREQLGQIKPGTPRAAVRDVLGTPLLTSVFHGDRWDYAFTLKRQGSPEQARKVTVYFKGDVVDKVQADELPSESEFVATLKTRERPGAVPPLEATDEALRKFPPPARPVPAPLPAAVAPGDYPPLESARKS